MMWIVTQLIFGQMAISLLQSPSVWRGVNNNSYSDNDANMEELDQYSGTELKKIELFRVILKDVQLKEYEKSNDFLIRWLREANMDLKSANQSLRDAMKWRQDNQIDTILNKTFAIKKLLRPCYVNGFDKAGGPIMIYKLKGYDIRNNLAHGYYENSLFQLYQCFELYLQESISGGPKREQIRVTAGIALVDVEGSSFKQHSCFKCVELYREICANGFRVYPRNSKFLVIINAAPFARNVIEMLKPALSPYTKNSLKIFGNDREEWTQFLLSVIEKDQLPTEYGGTK